MRNLPRIGGGSMSARAFARSLVEGILPSVIGGGGGDSVLPSGSIFDLWPPNGIVDQAGGLTITNSGGLSTEEDITGLTVLAFNGSDELETVGSPIEDFSAEVPFTCYFAYRPTEGDYSLAALFSFVDDASNYASVALVSGDEIRVRVHASTSGDYTTSSEDVRGLNITNFAVAFLSTSTCKIAINGTIYTVENLSNTRDAGDFVKLVLGAMGGELFRFTVFPGDILSNVHSFFEDYVKTWNAAADLDLVTGTPTFDWRPAVTGDYTRARGEANEHVEGQPVNGYGTVGLTSADIPQLTLTSATDEMILFDYPGAASLNAVANDKILVLVALKTNGTSEDDLFAIGDDASGGDRIYVTVHGTTGQVKATYKDSGGTSVTLSLGTVPTGVACTVAAQFDYAVEGRIGIAVNGGAMNYQTSASLASLDIALDHVVLGGQYSTKTSGTSDHAYLGLTVIEGQDYTAALGAQHYAATTGATLLTSGLSYGGANSDDLVGWWSATQPLVSHEGNNGQTLVYGSPASELGTYGGRAYHQPAATTNGYRIPINPVLLDADEALYLFVLFRNPSTGGSTSPDVLGQVEGALTSDRPTLVSRTNYSPKWTYGEIKNEIGTGNSDNLTVPAWTNDNVHVAMARVTRSADGLSYEAEGGLDGTWTGSPSSRTSNDLGNYAFTRMGPGIPKFTTHHTGMQVFDVLAFHDTGTAINASSIASYLAGLVTP